jgi:hypothetical protein
MAIVQGKDAYWVREIGFHLKSGEMLAVWSDPAQPLAYKAPGVDLLLAFDLSLSALPSDRIVVTPAEPTFALPPATQTIVSVVRLATHEETLTGQDHAIGVTPAGLAAALRAAASPLVSTIQPGLVELATEAEATAGADQARAVTPAALSAALSALLPRGIICMWSGSINQVPPGWRLCDGQDGTPDLRDRFVLGAGARYAAGAMGGTTSVISGQAGAHGHAITVHPYALTEREMPIHQHEYSVYNPPVADLLPRELSSHQHEFETHHEYQVDSQARSGGLTTPGLTGAKGGSQPHTHGASSAAVGAHAHSVDLIPPYYALAYLMKL